ncbi:MAG: dTDP-4-dehydrorhamnose 3,5-epimerase [Bdellovibrionaceae bacterium]|nr:dTDP-4-dehydrorhamnose 3,5-epimerase [Pseudobdellovibrionaceae bacterium]
MTFETLPLQGLILIQNRIFSDDRGYFTERYRTDLFKRHGIAEPFVQDNFSWSKPGVIRGLHFQHQPAQGKLVTCISGKILDVAVDIRLNSPTFGQHYKVELNARTPTWLWLPAGFAHGFSVLGEEPAHVLYKVTAGWGPGGEGGIFWKDPKLGIDWQVSSPHLSSKDMQLPSFEEYRNNPKFFWNSRSEAPCHT